MREIFRIYKVRSSVGPESVVCVELRDGLLWSGVCLLSVKSWAPLFWELVESIGLKTGVRIMLFTATNWTLNQWMAVHAKPSLIIWDLYHDQPLWSVSLLWILFSILSRQTHRESFKSSESREYKAGHESERGGWNVLMRWEISVCISLLQKIFISVTSITTVGSHHFSSHFSFLFSLL